MAAEAQGWAEDRRQPAVQVEGAQKAMFLDREPEQFREDLLEPLTVSIATFTKPANYTSDANILLYK